MKKLWKDIKENIKEDPLLKFFKLFKKSEKNVENQKKM
jgi:hypothetical protein